MVSEAAKTHWVDLEKLAGNRILEKGEMLSKSTRSGLPR